MKRLVNKMSKTFQEQWNMIVRSKPFYIRPSCYTFNYQDTGSVYPRAPIHPTVQDLINTQDPLKYNECINGKLKLAK